ncbi:hypothetical protein TNCV_4897241 [Trichonephila clavipes]|nr:hypothetical protein TNCV_4897241 [Trichonephila clavipes]
MAHVPMVLHPCPMNSLRPPFTTLVFIEAGSSALVSTLLQRSYVFFYFRFENIFKNPTADFKKSRVTIDSHVLLSS